MKKYNLLLATLLSITSSLFAQTAEETFDAKCSMCHMKTKPLDKSTLIAPPLMGVMNHIKMQYPNRENAITFIKDYVLDPSAQKAVCMPQKIKRFGLMPSQKGNITEEELEKVSGWMFDNFPLKTMTGKKGCQSKAMPKPNIKKPFLIKSKALPHFVGLIQKNWNNLAINLSKEQKARLKESKQKTLHSVKKISAKIAPLEKNIVKLSKNRADIEDIMPLVKQVATLKTKATKVHLECIKETKSILTPMQLKTLLMATKG